MESVSVDLSRWAIWRPWLCRGMYSMGCCCCCKEWQKVTNKYVSTPWRWNLMVEFLSLTFTLIFTVHPTAQRSWGLPKKEHPHSPLPILLSYHNKNFEILWHVCGVLMNVHEDRSTWSRDRAENVLWSTCKVPTNIDRLRPDLPPSPLKVSLL